MIYPSLFTPPLLLKNRHSQTIAASMLLPAPKVSYIRERIVTDDADFFDVDWLYPSKNSGIEHSRAPLLVLQHGLEGSSNSAYIRRLADYFSQRGYRVAAVNFRGCSGENNNRNYSYHAGFYSDLKFLIEREYAKNPAVMISVIGISLGGSCLLALAENIQSEKIYRYGLISVPFDLDAGLRNIEKGSNKLYNHYFTYQVKKSYLRKYKSFQSKELLPVTPNELDNITSLRDFDDKITAPLNGYSSGFDYYSQNRPLSSLAQLKGLSDKVGIFIAEDDPLLAASALMELETICADNFHYWRAQKGGHVGFVARDGLLRHRHWLLPTVFQWIDG